MNERLKHDLNEWYHYFMDFGDFNEVQAAKLAIEMQRNSLIYKGLFVDDPNEDIGDFGSSLLEYLTEEVNFLREEANENTKGIITAINQKST